MVGSDHIVSGVYAYLRWWQLRLFQCLFMLVIVIGATGRLFAADYKLVDLMPQLAFFEPTDMVFVDGMRSFLILERDGNVAWVECRSSCSEVSRYKLPGTLRTHRDDDGATAMALHPQVKTGRPYLYVGYSAREGRVRRGRLVRLTLDLEVKRILETSQEVLIDQVDRSVWHNMGFLTFGDDGYLYIGMGDEGGEYDEFGNGQIINKNLYSGILRIDVDCRGKNKPPVRQPKDGLTANYCIPAANPWANDKDQLGEFLATGVRMPQSFTKIRDDIWWFTDVGSVIAEELNEFTPAGNYGWPLKEGEKKIKKGIWLGKKTIDPIYAYRNPPTMDMCIIGGAVTTETIGTIPRGSYIFGDNMSGRIRYLDARNKPVQIATVPYSAKDGIYRILNGPSGEVLILVARRAGAKRGKVYRLATGTPGERPHYLTDNLSFISEGYTTYSYTVEVGAWKNGATLQRTVHIPKGSAIQDRDGQHRFPSGTVFEMGMSLVMNKQILPVETRFMELNDNGVRFFVTGQGTNGRFMPRTDQRLQFGNHFVFGEKPIGDQWSFGDPDQCSVCHRPEAPVLGWRFNNASIVGEGRSNVVHGVRARGSAVKPSLELHLGVQCYSCHFRDGDHVFVFDGDPSVSMADKNLFDRASSHGGKLAVRGKPEHSLIYQRVKRSEMPPIGHQYPNETLQQLLSNWIRSQSDQK